jgi:ferritin-like metal-binding protein YciE
MNSHTTHKRTAARGKVSQSTDTAVHSNAPRAAQTASGLDKLFETELKDIYWAEKALIKAIPKMMRNCSSESLQDALDNHLDETKVHVIRLEKAFDLIGMKAESKKCEAMTGLIKEAEETMSEFQKGPIRDAAIIACAQKVEHYEIASYGTLCAFAKSLGVEKVAELFHQTLMEEKNADTRLSLIGETSVNVHAGSEAGLKRKRA